ncbi:hypothetical protein [Eisenibacter elegans]|jgi:hypothetical protein|uniref:hypothetical protein n=1 Tax=Eisenibacter elegans TaxID=997 RepID=UPI00054E79B9|nr:hypothetical protein [Eisenibacter elegans]
MKYLIPFCLMLLVASTACNRKKNNEDPAPDTANLTSTNTVTDAQGNVYTVGFDQATSINQNPFVRKVNAQGQEQWRLVYENTPVDGRAVLVTLDEAQNPWVVFTVDGGSNDAGAIQRRQVASNAFQGVYNNSYGSGGGPKVSLVARLNPNTGIIERGTFVAARLTSGNTNTLNITKIAVSQGKVQFEISSAAWPPGEGTSYVRFPNITDADRIDNAFKIYYEMDTDLRGITKAVLLRQ